MKKLSEILVYTIVIIVVLVTCGFTATLLSKSSHGNNPYEEKQKDLAKKLGVKIEQYSYVAAFPLGYFYSSLKPGMTIEEVHNVVQGFDKVLRCGEYDKTAVHKIYYFSEIYYYFSSDDLHSLRFEMFYDRQGKYEKFQPEDKNSRTIRTDGCETGLIEK